jgi:hypothetical protein
MGLIALLVFIVIVVVCGYCAIWFLKWIAPSHPDIIDKLIWALVVGICLIRVAQAVGLVGQDIQVPHIPYH